MQTVTANTYLHMPNLFAKSSDQKDVSMKMCKNRRRYFSYVSLQLDSLLVLNSMHGNVC